MRTLIAVLMTCAASGTTWAQSSIPVPVNTWVNPLTNGLPVAAVGYDTLVYDPGIKKSVMWGDYHNVTSEANEAIVAYDFAANRWDLLGLGGNFHNEQFPEGGHPVNMLTYSPSINSFISYCCWSGSQGYEMPMHMWLFDPVGLVGRDKQTPTRPGLTEQAGAAFDVTNNVYVFFDSSKGTWTYNVASNTWTQNTPNGTPPTTSGFYGIAYNSSAHKIYLFGGQAGAGYSNDLYTYDVPSNTWTKLNPTGTLPSPREWMGFAYDSTNNVFLMFSGQNASGVLNDTWIYDPAGNSWAQQTPVASPPVSTQPSFTRLAYDSDDNVFVMVWAGTGGYAAGSAAGYAVQTWLYRYAGAGSNAGTISPAYTPPSGSINNNSDGWASEPTLASTGSNLYTGWIELGKPYDTTNTAYPHPFVSQLSGSSWTGLGTSALSLDSEQAGYNESHAPSLTVVGSTPWMSWYKTSSSGSFLPNSLYAKSWNGSSWVGGAVGVVNAASGSNASSRSQILGVGSTPHVAFIEVDRSSTPIYCYPWCKFVYVKSWDGSAWNLKGTGTLNRNPGTGNNADSVSITSDGTNPIVAWTEYTQATSFQADTPPQVYVSQWNGSVWQALGGSVNVNSSNWAYDASITYLNGQPYVAWTERSQSGNSQVYVKTWNGSTWSLVGSGALIKDPNTGWAFRPSLVSDGANLYIGWVEQQNLGQKAQAYVSMWNGSSWQALGNSLNTDPLHGSAERISLAILNGHPVAAWGELSLGSTRQIFVNQWNGSAWGLPTTGPLDTTPPTVPTNVSATAMSPSQISVSWTASTDNQGVTGYKIYRGGAQIGTTASTTYSDAGLSGATTYSYTVAAYDAAGNTSNQSAAATATTPADTIPPTVPTNVSATAITASQVTLSWTASTDNVGVAGYKIYRQGAQIGTTASTTYSDTGLSGATTYTYSVAAYDAAGNTSNQSVAASVTTPSADTTPPTVPTNVTATAISASQINVSWTASTDNVGVAGYKIYRGGAQVATSVSPTYADSGLSAATAYSYTVAAYDAAGNTSNQSIPASATTQSAGTPSGTSSANVPPTYNTTHPRLPFPDQAYLLSLYNNTTEMAKYNAAANSFNPTNPTADVGQFRRAMIAYLANKAGGNTAVATTYLNLFRQLADLGGTWGPLLYKVDDGVATGTYTVTSATANFLTGCGGSCSGQLLSILGRMYNINQVVNANTIVLSASNPAPTGSALPLRIFSTYQPYVGIRMAMVYDWFYNDLDAATRSAYLNQLEVQAELWEEDFVGVGASPYNDVFYVRDGPDGFIAAFAIYPDYDKASPAGGTCPTKPCGTYHVNYMVDKLFNVYLPVWKQIIDGGGAWHEDWSGYVNSGNGVGLTRWIVPALLSWQSASGDGVFSRESWLKDFAYWTMYFTRPDYTMQHIGEVRAGNISGEYTLVYDDGAALGSLNGLAEIYNDAVLRGWARLVNQEFGSDHNSPSGFEPSAWPFFAPDNVTKPVSTRAVLPLTRNLTGLGVIDMRSGWGENDTDVTLKYGDSFWSHTHADTGSFTISHRGNLAIDSGTYIGGSNSKHEIQYGRQTISQNSLLIVDPNDAYPNSQFCQIYPEVPGPTVCMPLANDGGQRRAGTFYQQLGFTQYNSPNTIQDWQANAGYYHMGTLVSYASSPNYTYAAIDITPAYNIPQSITSPNAVNRTNRANSVVRQMLFIQPGYVIVYDQVNSTNPSFKKKWLLHSVNMPIVSGNRYEIDRTENVTDYSEAWTKYYGPLLSNANLSGSLLKYQYSGKLVGWMVSPNAGAITLVGGPGKEFWIEDPTSPGTGTNWNQCMYQQCSLPSWVWASPTNAQDILTPDPSVGLVEPGSWRIEEAPSVASNQDYFLNVMLATDYSNTNIPASVTGSQDAVSLSATWSDANNTYTITFPKAGVGGHVTVTGATSINVNLPVGTATCDLNGDGVVNSADVNLAMAMVVGTAPVDMRADLDGDGAVTVVDVQRIINASLGGVCRVGP